MFQNRDRWVATGIFLVGILLLALDIIDDVGHGSSISHLIEESVIVLLCVVGVISLWFRYLKSHIETVTVKRELTQAKADLDKFKLETSHLVSDMNAKVRKQFDDWSFSEAEKEIALLVLKGMSVKDISTARSTSEKTVTQQLSSIYQKSGLHGRAELSAFFLEDLFS